MPSYYAAGVTARLSISSLAASTTTEASIKAGADAKSKSVAAAWTIEHGQELKENDVRCYDEDGRLHFVGRDQEVPFLCVGVPVPRKADPSSAGLESLTQQEKISDGNASTKILQSVEKDDVDSSLSSLGSTPKITPDKLRSDTPQEAAVVTTPTPSVPGSRQVSQQPSQILKLKFVKRPSSPSVKASPPVVPNSTRQSSIDRQIRETDIGNEPKALTLVAHFSTRSFTRTQTSYSDDLKVEVYYNGVLSNCAFLPARDKSNQNELTLRFSGLRTHRVLEKAWILQTAPDSALASDARDDVRQRRWDDICQAMHNEANNIGFDKLGQRPPTGEMLDSLSKMHIPQANDNRNPSGEVSEHFGVIDLIVTLGTGKKFPTSGGYLVAPQRFVDDAFTPGPLDELRTHGSGDLKVNAALAPVAPDGLLKMKELLDMPFVKPATLTAKPIPAAQLNSPMSSTSRPDRSLITPKAIPKPSSFRAQPQVLPFAVVIPYYPADEEQRRMIHETSAQRSTSATVGSTNSQGQASASFRKVFPGKAIIQPARTTTDASKPCTDLQLTELRRLARRPYRTIDSQGLGLSVAAKILDFGQHMSSSDTKLSRRMIPSLLPLQTETPKTPSSGIKLRLPSPKKRVTTRSNVFDRVSLPPMQQQALVTPEIASAPSLSSQSLPTVATPKSKAKRNAGSGPSPPKASTKRKARGSMGMGKPPLKRQKSETPQTMPTPAISNNLSSSPSKNLMPPPSSSPIKLADYEMPKLSKNSVVTFVDDKDETVLGSGYRQIRKERGGYFKEREVLVAFRFVCW